jgi:hypothetical protein
VVDSSARFGGAGWCEPPTAESGRSRFGSVCLAFPSQLSLHAMRGRGKSRKSVCRRAGPCAAMLCYRPVWILFAGGRRPRTGIDRRRSLIAAAAAADRNYVSKYCGVGDPIQLPQGATRPRLVSVLCPAPVAVEDLRQDMGLTVTGTCVAAQADKGHTLEISVCIRHPQIRASCVPKPDEHNIT